MQYGPEPRKEGQSILQCKRLNDHESHDWYGMPERWCPGVIAQPLDSERCGNWNKTYRCVLAEGHGGRVHRNDSGDEWPMHLPFEETRPAPSWAVEEVQCDRVTAHGPHTSPANMHCPGVGAHHLTQIGKGGPHDPDKHYYRDRA